MNLELLMKSDFYILNLNESTSLRWCVNKVNVSANLKIVKKDIFKMYITPEYLNGVIIGFYYYCGDKAKIPELIEKLKIYQQVSKVD